MRVIRSTAASTSGDRTEMSSRPRALDTAVKDAATEGLCVELAQSLSRGFIGAVDGEADPLH